ncbi:protein Bouncer-like [Clupea harengus]|uniref:Protein Bouncer-like n=1 Tax=Clupea harengus TaxID=7950 RepID=A0A6P8ESF9_CLUHA|nr:protein Bouncer-like [Clupea harengus]
MTTQRSIPALLNRAALCLFWCVTLSWLASGVLVCNYSPLMYKRKPSINVTTECLSTQRCFTGKGYYGPLHIFSSQGCVAAHLCGSSEIRQHRLIGVNLTYTCCCRYRCNEPPTPESALERLLGLDPEATANITTTTPDPLDLCPENSTSLALDGV